MAKLIYLIIHCTATREGQNITSIQIRKMHTSKPPEGRGWKQVGYSDMVHLDGTLENLVPYNNDDIVQPREITNGASGLNSISRHIVYVGGLDSSGKRAKDTRTMAQKLALGNYIRQFVAAHPNIKVAGHYDFATKACPSFNVQLFCKEIGINENNIYYKGL
jgi:hypothetical protein